MKQVLRWLALSAALLAPTAAMAAGKVTIATVYDVAYPLKAIAYPGYAFYPATFDGLTEIGPDGVLSPALAVSWRQEGTAGWVFEIRPNVTFANGEPLDAAAVAATIDHVLGPGALQASARREIASIARTEVRGPLTLALMTKTPDLMLPRKLVSIKILPPKYLADGGVEGFNKQPYGTGPFVETSRTPARITLKANPHAWRPPHVSELTVVKLPDNTSRLQALAARLADIALDIPVDAVALLEEAGGRAVPWSTGSVDVIQFNTSRDSPLRDPRVRRALNYAVDKQRIVDGLLHGIPRVATQFANKGSFGYDETLTQPFPYDPAKAKALLAEAGYPNGFDLPIELMASVITSPYEQVAADLAEVGVRVTLTTISVMTYSAHYYQNTWKGLAFYGGYNAAPSMDALAPLKLHSCLWQNPWYCDHEIAARITAADASASEPERLQMTRDLMRRLNADPPAILLYEGFKITGLGPRVKTFAAPNGYVRYQELETID